MTIYLVLRCRMYLSRLETVVKTDVLPTNKIWARIPRTSSNGSIYFGLLSLEKCYAWHQFI